MELAAMTSVTFISGNSWHHDEVRRLLSGVRVERSRVGLDKGTGETLEAIATARVLDGFRQLRAPCVVENTGMFLETREAFPGSRFKRLFGELGEEAFARRYGGARGVVRIVVAYTADGRDVQLFDGQNEGTLLDAPRGAGGYGWDRLWVPNGFDRTLAELASSKYVVNMRLRPFLELGAVLRGDGFAGVFESHITVAPCDERAFAEACSALDVKCICIELPRGEHRRQPMTGAHHHGSYRDVIQDVHRLAETLVRGGFTVVRTKLEAVGPHRDIPLTDDAARAAPPSNYFEHHAKVVLPAGADEAPIAEAFRGAGAHLSRNARRNDGEGARERFVTVRSWGVGQRTADERFERVVAVAHGLGLSLRNRVREYTVHDAGHEVDRGWMS
jgi:inosine/xanthosine triphosphate pyrophosphatase family protein